MNSSEQIEYQISPAIASTTLIMSLAWLGYMLAYAVLGSESIFATLTNICFVSAGLFHEYRSPHRRGAVQLVGGMASSSMPFVLLGASSFAFHLVSDIGSEAHTLDIFMGWVLLLHVALVPTVVAVVSFIPTHLVQLVSKLTMSVGIVVGLLSFASFYEHVYREQRFFYLVIGSLAMTASALCRHLLLYDDDDKLRCVPVLIALSEFVVGIIVVVAAIFSQGELLGRRVSVSSDMPRYDIFHGQWHFLLATICSASYVRANDAARRLSVRKHSNQIKCICSWPILDVLGGGAVLLHALLVITLKERNVDLEIVRGLLSVSTFALLAHACVVLRVWRRRTFSSTISSSVSLPLIIT